MVRQGTLLADARRQLEPGISKDRKTNTFEINHYLVIQFGRIPLISWEALKSGLA
jgi:hypothetical protein